MLKRTTYPEVTVKGNRVLIKKSSRSKRVLELTREQAKELVKVLNYALQFK